MTSQTRVVFDTNAYSHLFRGNKIAVEVLQLAPQIAVPVIVLAELLTGFQRGNRYEANLVRLEQFLSLARVSVVAPDQATAFMYSTAAAQLEEAGQMIQTNDLWIAALTTQHEDVLFSFDAHFSRVRGLRFGQNVSELGL